MAQEEKLQILRTLTPAEPKEELQILRSADQPQEAASSRNFRSLTGADPFQQAENVKGALKSVGQTFLGGALAVPQVIEAYGGPKEPKLFEKARDLLKITPKQEGGAMLGRMAQYVIPGMAAAKAPLLTQAAVGGLSSAAVASGAGEDPRAAGAMGMIAPMIGKAFQPAVKPLRRGAMERVSSAIGPRGLEEQKELSKVLPEITARRPFAWSSEAFKGQFEKEAEKIALQLDEAIDAFSKGGDISQLPKGAAKLSGPASGTVTGDILMNTNRIASSMDDLIGSIEKSGGAVTPEAQTVLNQLKQVRGEIKDIGRLKAASSRLGTESSIGLPRVQSARTIGATIEKLRELKQWYGDIISGTGKHFYRNVADPSRAGAAKEGYHAIRTAMVEAVPQAKELGKEYQRQATVRDLLAKQELRTMSGGNLGVGRVAEAGALAGGLAYGSPRAATSGAVLASILKLGQSTPWKLAMAKWRTALADSLQRGDMTAASQIVGQIQIEAFNSQPGQGR